MRKYRNFASVMFILCYAFLFTYIYIESIEGLSEQQRPVILLIMAFVIFILFVDLFFHLFLTSKVKNKKVFLVSGCSGAGKTSLVNKLFEENNIPSLKSYTTRDQRTDEPSDTYHFIDYSVINKYLDDCLQIFIDTTTKNVYFSTVGDLTAMLRRYEAVTIIITPNSVNEVFTKLKSQNVDIVYVHFITDDQTRYTQMKNRGDTCEQISARKPLDDFIKLEYQKFTARNEKLGITTIEVENSENGYKDVITEVTS